MGKPAARLTDMHTCPMVTPGTPPIPHVGGPISGPCVPPVLIGFLPAATVGDMCVCVGPPDTIAMGSPTVFIGGKMAARMGDPTMHGGVIVVGCPTVLIGEMGMGGAGGGGNVTPLMDVDSLGDTQMCMMAESPPAPQSAQLTCPMKKPDMQSLPEGWQEYHGKSWWFHCSYEGIIETRKPSAGAPQNECFYDDKGVLVDEHHPYAGCGGTPNEYDSDANAFDHTFNDSGGIWHAGGDAFAASRQKGLDEGWKATKETAGEAWDGTKSVVTDAWEGTKQTSNEVMNWMGGLFD